MIEKRTKHYKSIFVSDIHLGSRMSQAEAFLDFIKYVECEKLYLVGDIIDGWALHRSFYWPQQHNDVIQKLMRKARKDTEVIYLPGNHDEFLRSFGEHEFGNIKLQDKVIHKGLDGKTYIVMHGDQFDAVVNNIRWLAYLGSWAYDFSMMLNLIVTKIRNIFNLPYWSLSAWAKYKVKEAVNFITDYEDNLAGYAQSKQVDGVICGHIHHPNIRKMNNGIMYMNSGDWVESCSALVENDDGSWEIIKWTLKESL